MILRRNRLSFAFAAVLTVLILQGVGCSSDNDGDGSFAANGGSANTGAGPGKGSGGAVGTTGGSDPGSSGGNSSSTGGTGTGGSVNPGVGGANTGAGGLTNVGGSSTACANTLCNNGIDDDGDKLIDGFDPECTGPCDNVENSFATGIPGDNKDGKWQDCFFDGNSGAGDDRCRYHTDCLYGTLPQTDERCKVSADCLKYCAKGTPNGCDCFGCCSVQLANGSSVDVVTVGTCSVDKIADTNACPRCTKSEQCNNTCKECELCPGKTTVPASCNPTGAGGATGAGGSGAGGTGGTPHQCGDGEQVCSLTAPCGSGYYCQQGCCLPTIR